MKKGEGQGVMGKMPFLSPSSPSRIRTGEGRPTGGGGPRRRVGARQRPGVEGYREELEGDRFPSLPKVGAACRGGSTGGGGGRPGREKWPAG